MNIFNLNELKITTLDKGIKFQVQVIPGSSKSEITGITEGILKIKLNSQPVEGKANKECIKLLAKFFGVPKTSVEIVSGEKSKHKTVFIKSVNLRFS
jgi:uncharacterized protein (TIGR00251 family)